MKDNKVIFFEGIENKFVWENEPEEYAFDDGLIIKTKPYTDFWQRTHYGFRRDDGHCYITEIEGDFSFSAQLSFESKMLYDQCGVMLRIDEENWVKASVEFENMTISRLGSVVTNLGYSDWATSDIPTNIDVMWYRFNKNGKDVLIENSYDGIQWKQMRILHLHHEAKKVKVGVYACSPQNSSFECKIKKMVVDENTWAYKE